MDGPYAWLDDEQKKRRDELVELRARYTSRHRIGDMVVEDEEERVRRALAYAAWRDEAYASGECASPAVEYEVDWFEVERTRLEAQREAQ